MNKQVTVNFAPISDRYWFPGCSGTVDTSTKSIRLGGAWFDLDDRFVIVEAERNFEDMLHDAFDKKNIGAEVPVDKIISFYEYLKKRAEGYSSTHSMRYNIMRDGMNYIFNLNEKE